MSKIRIYLEKERISDVIEITSPPNIHKIKDVLRLGPGAEVFVFDGEGREYLCRIKEVKKNSVFIKKEKEQRKEKLPDKRIILGFPLLREQKLDFILQKATELGVSGFCPFICRRGLQVNPNANKLNRWRTIVIEAVRQSERLWIPRVQGVASLDEVAKKPYQVKLVGSIKGKSIHSVIDKKWKEIFLIVGPEGDFSAEEVELFKENNFNSVRLSTNTLRTETAAILSVGIIRSILDAG